MEEVQLRGNYRTGKRLQSVQTDNHQGSRSSVQDPRTPKTLANYNAASPHGEAKASHWRYKQKLKRNDPTWRNDLKVRNENKSKFRAELKRYLSQNREELNIEKCRQEPRMHSIWSGGLNNRRDTLKTHNQYSPQRRRRNSTNTGANSTITQKR